MSSRKNKIKRNLAGVLFVSAFSLLAASCTSPFGTKKIPSSEDANVKYDDKSDDNFGEVVRYSDPDNSNVIDNDNKNDENYVESVA
ncbi:hypothetical protein C4M83_04490, partial [Mycoplasmopsis pullorum]